MKTCCHIQGLTVELLKTRLKVCQADNARYCDESEHLRKMVAARDAVIASMIASARENQ